MEINTLGSNNNFPRHKERQTIRYYCNHRTKKVKLILALGQLQNQYCVVLILLRLSPRTRIQTRVEITYFGIHGIGICKVPNTRKSIR